MSERVTQNAQETITAGNDARVTQNARETILASNEARVTQLCVEVIIGPPISVPPASMLPLMGVV